MLAARLEAILHEAARPAQHADGTPMSPEESLEYMTSFMRDGLGLPAHLADIAVPLLGSGNIDDVPTEAIEDHGLIDHVENAMRNDPDAYFRSAYAQQEYRQSLERFHAPRPAVQLGEPHDPAYRAAVRVGDTQRRGEIEAMMREDGGRRYWGDESVRREYSQILQRQTAPPPMPAAEPAPADDNQSADEGPEL